MFFLSLGIVLFLAFSFLIWASWPWTLREKRLETRVLEVNTEGPISTEEEPSVLKVLTWNLGFLYGEGSEGPGYESKDKAFYQKKLDTLVNEIQSWNPDIICLQEIDFASSRSHHINQAQYVAIKAGYPYVAEAVSWEANYIPFPYWPFSRHFGAMKSGGAILSRYPLTNHSVTLLQKPLTHAWWYNLFYLHRYFQEVTIKLGKKEMKVINLHLEAFDKLDRQNQIRALTQKINEDKIDLVAGDFNMLPTSATKRSKFTNEDNYENDPSYELMMKSMLSEVIPDEIYAKDESLYFTFPASRPDRRLDYIFYRQGLKMMKAEILPSALSDHLPLKATFQIDSPRFNPYSQ